MTELQLDNKELLFSNTYKPDQFYWGDSLGEGKIF
jgi:hypothetical protein